MTIGTYGSIIQHLEPSHVADLPVPRLSKTTERMVHELVEKAANNRVRASELLADVQGQFKQILGKPLKNGTPGLMGISQRKPTGEPL